MKDNNELLPCPFCGGEAKTWNTPHVGGLHDCVVLDAFGVAVECSKCGITTRGYFQESEAIEAWNTRAERTCNMRFLWDDYEDGLCFDCSECRKPVFTHGGAPSYCSKCGRKVDEVIWS